jgi:hypothetical protein
MTPDLFRRIALGLPGAVEGAHMGHPDFRANGRIFATLYPDGYRALAQWGELEAVEVHTDWSPHPERYSAAWGDTVGVFRRRKGRGLRLRLAAALIRLLLRV